MTRPGWMRSSLVASAAGIGAILLPLLAPAAARAIDLLDEKIQIHGYFEAQVRGISSNFTEEFDLTQWYNVLNVEIDLDILPNGWGPIDSITGFVRGELRYDCVWTRACGLSGSTDVFGNRSRRLPGRLSLAENPNQSGAANFGTPTFRQPGQFIETLQQYPPTLAAQTGVPLPARTEPFRGFNQLPSIDTLYNVRQRVGGVEYLPAFYTFQRYRNYGFALRSIRGNENRRDTQAMPWDPKDNIDPQGTLADRVNPFRVQDINPITGLRGGNALPYRPAPLFGPNQGPSDQAQGIFYPSAPYANYLRNGGSGRFQQNFSQEELAWNRGASQEQTKELKEAYLDINMFEGSLFMRLGKQTIVWGKTELFATTDQFNPNDLALASLPALEESRIPVWAARAIYSFYEVGPLSDVRLEAAVDLDTFYPADLGRCGEAYTPNPVCNKTFGLLGHGIAHLGIAGEDRPPDWWTNGKGLQAGVRLEFRWEQFSFALVDFWNYAKVPYQARLTSFSRNVDPTSGRPRRIGATGPCVVGNEPACLQPGTDALQNSPLNQQYFTFVCSASVGFSPGLDPNVCAQSVFNSARTPVGLTQITEILGEILAGSPTGILLLNSGNFTNPAVTTPLVALSIDPGDPLATVPSTFGAAANNPFVNFANPLVVAPGQPVPTYNLHNIAQTVTRVLKPQQQALLGCGPLYGIPCDTNPVVGGVATGGGIDLLNAEASALVQSWGGFDGQPIQGFRTDQGPQPGTVSYSGGPVCTRVDQNGQQVILPGCRGPNDPGYDPAVDGANTGAAGPVTFVGSDGNVYPVASIGFPAGIGATAPLGAASLGGKVLYTQGHPFTGATWQSEMAALSWNYQMLLVALSDAVTTNQASGLQLIPGRDPTLSFDYRTPAAAYRVGGCSFVQPQFCSNIRALWAVIGATRNTINAGGNGRFGRRDFVWAGGGDVVLQYQRRNVLGFSTDFAEDRSKTNWSIEFTWVNREPFQDNNQFDGITKTGTYNLTVSADRPTFINFLNQNRTFFFNTQWFFQYVPGQERGFTTNGPWNILFTFTAQTGYFQDRLLPSLTSVYDFQSNSGALLPRLQYRFTENFAATFGMAFFWGRFQGKEYPLNPIALDNLTGPGAYTQWVENGLSPIHQRDEAFFILRYTF